jgi:hypothetical protein
MVKSWAAAMGAWALFGLFTVDATAGVLTLTLDRIDGRAWIENRSGTPVRTNGYHIASLNGLLNPAGWFSFQDLTRQDSRAANALLGSLTWTELLANSNAIVESDSNGETVAAPGFRLALGKPLAALLAGDIRFIYQDLDKPGDAKSVVGPLFLKGEPEFPWQNPRNRLDINNNGRVEALDALLIINTLNSEGPRDLTLPPVPPLAPPPYFDANGDNRVTAIDALNVIDFINSGGASAAVPEPAGILLLLIGAASLFLTSRR